MALIECEIKGERLHIDESELEKVQTTNEGHINGSPAGEYATAYWKVVDGVRTMVHRSAHLRAHTVDPIQEFAA